MLEGLLHQTSTMQGVVFQWSMGLGVVFQWDRGLGVAVQWGRGLGVLVQWGKGPLGVAEQKMCGTGGQHTVQLGRVLLHVEALAHFEGGLDSSLGIFGSWSSLYFVYL